MTNEQLVVTVRPVVLHLAAGHTAAVVLAVVGTGVAVAAHVGTDGLRVDVGVNEIVRVSRLQQTSPKVVQAS